MGKADDVPYGLLRSFLTPFLMLAFRPKVKGLRNVGRVQEIAGLRAVADHGERFSFQLLLEKNAEHRAIRTRSP